MTHSAKQVEQAQQSGDLQKAAEIQYDRLPKLEKVYLLVNFILRVRNEMPLLSIFAETREH